jgi:HK97 family phage major capsid protein
MNRTTLLGTVRLVDAERRDAEAAAADGAPPAPRRIEGVAVPYGVTIPIAGGSARERFRAGAFREAVAAWTMRGDGARLGVLDRHDGAVVAVVDALADTPAGVRFGAELLDVPEAGPFATRIARGVNGVSVEFVPGQVREARDGALEHIRGAQLAAIAGAYAPAYDAARVALRDVRGAQRRIRPMTPDQLRARETELETQAADLRELAEAEGRSLSDTETTQLEDLEQRRANVIALRTTRQAELERRELERQTVAQLRPAGGAIVTRSEPVYRPGVEQSYFRDMLSAAHGDAAAAERHARHRALVTDLADQLERRAIVSSDLGGAYPTTYMPDLYVPDLAYTGPFGGFFSATTIGAPNPIIVPSFGSVTGDTGVQSPENTALPNVNVATTPITVNPKTIGGEAIVSRQTVDGASPGTDVIIANELRELLMRDTEREIAAVLEALTARGTIADTAGTTPAQSGRDLVRGLNKAVADMYLDRFLPAEGIFTNGTDWMNLVQGEDLNGRPLVPFAGPQNASGDVSSGLQRAIISGVPTLPAWALTSALNEIVARANDGHQWRSAVLDVRLTERNGPVSIVFAVWQYYAFAVLQPKGVRRWTYTNVLATKAEQDEQAARAGKAGEPAADADSGKSSKAK